MPNPNESDAAMRFVTSSDALGRRAAEGHAAATNNDMMTCCDRDLSKMSPEDFDEAVAMALNPQPLSSAVIEYRKRTLEDARQRWRVVD